MAIRYTVRNKCSLLLLLGNNVCWYIDLGQYEEKLDRKPGECDDKMICIVGTIIYIELKKFTNIQLHHYILNYLKIL